MKKDYRDADADSGGPSKSDEDRKLRRKLKQSILLERRKNGKVTKNSDLTWRKRKKMLKSQKEAKLLEQLGDYKTFKRSKRSDRIVDETTTTADKNKSKTRINEPCIVASDQIVDEEQKRRKDRDRKALFVKSVPLDATIDDLKSLHPTILSVRHVPGRTYAYLNFESASACKKAHYIIANTPLKCGTKLVVDFCGEKAQNRPDRAEVKSDLPINPLQLYVSGYPSNITKEQIQMLFAGSTDVHMKKSGIKQFCFVDFADADAATAAFDNGKRMKIEGATVDVMRARQKMRKSREHAAKNKSSSSDKKLTEQET